MAVAQQDLIEEFQALSQQVSTLLNQRRLSEAIPLAQRALAISEKVRGPEHAATAVLLNTLANLYQATRAYAQAEPLLQRALAIQEKTSGLEHPDTAVALNNLAGLYLDTDAYAKAEPLLQRALEIRERSLGREHADTAASLNNLALMYLYTETYAKAEPLLKRALTIAEKLLGPEHPHTATALNNLARLYRAISAYVQAEPLLKRALTIAEKVLGPEHPHTATALTNLAMLLWEMGHVEGAFSLVERSHYIEAMNTQRFLVSGSESRKQLYLNHFRRRTYAALSLAFALSGQRATTLGATIVLQTKGRVLDAMADSRGRLRHSMKPEHRTLFDDLTVVAQQLSSMIHQGPGNLSPEVYRLRMQELSSQQERLETELAKQSAEFREQIAPVSLTAVQTAIPKGAALVEWYRYDPFDPKGKGQLSGWGKPRYGVYVLKSTGELAAEDVGDAETVEGLIRDFRRGLGDSTSAYVQEVAKELYEKLLKPLQQHLGDVEHLFISPDGAMNLVPFAALVDETGTYLGGKKNITYLTSGRDLVRYRTPSLGQVDAVVVADPNYGNATAEIVKVDLSDQGKHSVDLNRGGVVFPPLPGTAEEAKQIKRLLKINDDHVLTQARATEDQLKQLRGPRILHVATHGFFLNDNELPAATLNLGSFSERVAGPLGENPLLRSGLALAGANLRQSGENEDGILTAAEVAQMDLRGTQLVVLSACETGVGDVQNGEGVYGLRRALVLAGGETQVTSLWKVADEATKDLMVDYYQRLLKGEGRSEALRHAQLSMMKTKDRSHPYYWAAFVPIGNWTPLAKAR